MTDKKNKKNINTWGGKYQEHYSLQVHSPESLIMRQLRRQYPPHLRSCRPSASGTEWSSANSPPTGCHILHLRWWGVTHLRVLPYPPPSGMGVGKLPQHFATIRIISVALTGPRSGSGQEVLAPTLRTISKKFLRLSMCLFIKAIYSNIGQLVFFVMDFFSLSLTVVDPFVLPQEGRAFTYETLLGVLYCFQSLAKFCI